MTKYPAVRSEMETLDAMLAGASIARWGDGEWRCTVGGGCTSQRPEPNLARELKAALADGSTPKYLVGIPNPFNGCPREESWIRYTEPKFAGLLSKRPYYSSFITRPDNAPWIDTDAYWAKVRELWAGQNVVLVAGDQKSITPEMIHKDLKSGAIVMGPRQHAYAEIDRIESDVLATVANLKQDPAPRVLICLGTTASVLAWRLAKRGIHAMDVGHIGMFMRHAGAYRYGLDDMTSRAYRKQLEQLHASRRWGADGAKHAERAEELAVESAAATVLDYGCGEMKLAAALAPRRVSGYDPGIPERAKMPKPCDLVVCTDVLEHVEPTKIDAVLDHLFRLTGKVAYLVISLKPANAILADGRNAHLLVQPAQWWLDRLKAQGWLGTEAPDFSSEKELRVAVWKDGARP